MQTLAIVLFLAGTLGSVNARESVSRVAFARAAEPPVHAAGAPVLTSDTVRVVIAISDSLDNPDARIMLVRPAGRNDPPILVASNQATPADLARALSILAYSYRRHGRILDRELRTYVKPSGANATQRPYPEEAQMLREVHASPVDEQGPFRLTHAMSFLFVEQEGRFRLATSR